MKVADIFSADAIELERELHEHCESRLADSLQAISNDSFDEKSRLMAAHFLEELNRHAEAVSVLAEGLRQGCSAELHRGYVDTLAKCNRTEEAIAAARKALIEFPDEMTFRVREALLLPVLYHSPDEIEQYRTRFAEGLRRLRTAMPLDTPAQRRRALIALANHSNAILGYQGRNDRDLQAEYGDLLHRVMIANYPQWDQELKMPPVPFGEPLRIGYVSGRFADLSAMRYFFEWLRGHDRARFAVHAWHVGPDTDRVTDEVRRVCQSFHHFPDSLPESLENTCNSIRGRDLHALVFLDVGLAPLVTQLAALRLAPIQCMAWDQPITSGLATVDYAFSAALSEQEGAEAHYSEQLFKLPGVGVHYRKPNIPLPLLRKTRRDFRLREEGPVYLCCQSIFKFLPDHDDVFARIAQRVPKAQFVFVVTNGVVGADFIRRIDTAFRTAGTRAEDHCVLLPQLKHLDYWNLHLVSDVFLDTIGWSSGGSVFEAIACRIPVVTLPGELMRSRQAYAILSQLGVTDTIAGDKADYVEIAVRLASDEMFHEDIVERMVQGYPLLYSDTRSITALEDFFSRKCVVAPLQVVDPEASAAGGNQDG